MIFVPKKNIYFPKYIYKSKFHQKGNFAGFPAGTFAEQGVGPGIRGGTFSVFNSANAPNTITASFTFKNNGTITQFNDAGTVVVGTWDGRGGNDTLPKINYQFRYDIDGGDDVPNDGSKAVDVWLPAITGDDRWKQTQVGGGQRKSLGPVRMRLAASPFTEYDSSTSNIEVEVE